MRTMTSITIHPNDIKDISISKVTTDYKGICHVVHFGYTDALYLWDEAYELFIERIKAEAIRLEACEMGRNK